MLPGTCIYIVICWYERLNHKLVAMAIVVIDCVFSVRYQFLHWWPWEQLLVSFVFFVKKQLLLLRQTVFTVLRGLKLKIS